MPASVKFGKSGTLFSIDGVSYLGKWKTCEVRVRQDLVDNSGPADDWEYKTPRRVGATVTTSSFVSGTGTAELQLALPPTTTPVLVSINLLDGRAFTGTFYISDLGVSASDDPNEESLTLESTGTFAIA